MGTFTLYIEPFKKVSIIYGLTRLSPMINYWKRLLNSGLRFPSLITASILLAFNAGNTLVAAMTYNLRFISI